MTMSMAVLRVAIMAIVTSLLRVAPLLFLKKPIKNRWMQSFLYYVPYAVLMAMTGSLICFSEREAAAGIADLLLLQFSAGVEPIADCCNGSVGYSLGRQCNDYVRLVCRIRLRYLNTS